MSVQLFTSMEWFGGFQSIFVIVFLLVIGFFVVTAVRGLIQWNHNNQSPRLTVDASIVTKRTSVSVHHHNHGTGAGVHHSTSTTYYVTFEVASGDRMELKVKGHEYGMLAEGDRGQLSFQGTRYLGFARSGTLD
ncbi:MAG: DUF2500 domain-containing protein [Bacillota bacterium]|nr:DUF2500 domain-containing protein [Bacillota bacterium]